MDRLNSVLTILGTSAVGASAVAVLAFLARSLTIHFLSKDIEGYKATLQAKNEIELEKLKADLTKQTLEHEIRFRRVDEKVAKVLAGVYRRLQTLHDSVAKYVSVLEWSNEPSKEDKLKIASETNDIFVKYFVPNRIYIPPKLYEQIDLFAKNIRKIAYKMTDALVEAREGRQSDKDGWSEAYDAVESEAKPAFEKIVQEIQKRLGIKDLVEE
ncbi:MAG: hypothetical protein ABSA26_04535 [Thermoguttaceae bacterium]|jgi:hypothetical protein